MHESLLCQRGDFEFACRFLYNLNISYDDGRLFSGDLFGANTQFLVFGAIANRP
jgi:hypothetical protein